MKTTAWCACCPKRKNHCFFRIARPICRTSWYSPSIRDLGRAFLNLTWEVVDLDAATINFKVKKNRRMLDFPLNDKAFAVVRGWSGIRKCEYVFYNPETGGRWKDLRVGLKKACGKAGLEDVTTWHTFRQTFASRLNSNGADLVTVKELLGHSDIKTTMRYAHTNREAKRRAVARLGVTLVTLACQEDRLGVVSLCKCMGSQVDWKYGEVREWLNRAVSKTVEPLRVPWVRIPPCMQVYFQ